MADASRAQLYFVKEQSWGVTPAAALTELRFTSEDLGYTVNHVQSTELRSDRQITDSIRTGAEARGRVEVELSRGTHDALMEGALFGAWTSPLAIADAGDIAAVKDDSAFTSTATDFAAAGIAVGQWIRIAGFAHDDGANNGVYRVTAVSADKLGVSPEPAGDEAAGEKIAITGSMLRNGVAEQSFTLEKAFTDIGQFITLTGMVPGGMSLNIAAGAIVTAGFEFTGKSARIAGASAGTGTPAAAPAHPVMSAAGDVGDIMEGGKPLAGVHVASLSVALANNLRAIKAVGSPDSVDIGAGHCAVTGSLEVYFASAGLYETYLKGGLTSLSFRVTEGGGGGDYVFTLPRIRLTSGAVVAGGAGSDVMAGFGYQALRDPATGATLQIDRL